MATEKACLHLEDLGDNIHFTMNGKGNDLINLLLHVITVEPGFRQLLELSLMGLMMQEMKEESEENLADVFSKMKIGQA